MRVMRNFATCLMVLALCAVPVPTAQANFLGKPGNSGTVCFVSFCEGIECRARCGLAGPKGCKVTVISCRRVLVPCREFCYDY